MTVRILLVLCFLALLSGAPVRAQEPEPTQTQTVTPTIEATPTATATPVATATPTETATPLPSPTLTTTSGYSAWTLAGCTAVTVVTTPAETHPLTDMLVVLSVARELARRGETGLVIGCVPMDDNPAVCGGTYFALSTAEATEPVTTTLGSTMASAR